MPRILDERKRQVVSDAIHHEAISLFTKKGFDETTVDDIAEKVGISQRTFFRYFASKDDLLALNVLKYGDLLCDAIKSSPKDCELVEVVRKAVLAGVKYNIAGSRVRKIIEMSERSHAARQAHLSRMREVEDKLTEAFASRSKGGSKQYLKNRLLALTTLGVMHAAIFAWFNGEFKDLTTAVKEAFSTMSQVFAEHEETEERS
jgi:AcrR family transcriptional regulator